MCIVKVQFCANCQGKQATHCFSAEPTNAASTKSKRRRKAKQASKAKREAGGNNEPSSVESDSAVLLPDIVSVAVVSQPRPNTASSTTSKKSKSKSGKKVSSVLDESTQRLLSPLKNNKCQHEEKIAKAVENRELLLQEKSEKVRQQSKKVEDAKHQKAAAIKQIQVNMTDRMRRAEEKRMQQITTIKTRARDEATKVDEVNFINNWKSQNRILDVLEKVCCIVLYRSLSHSAGTGITLTSVLLSGSEGCVAAAGDGRRTREEDRRAQGEGRSRTTESVSSGARSGDENVGDGGKKAHKDDQC